MIVWLLVCGIVVALVALVYVVSTVVALVNTGMRSEHERASSAYIWVFMLARFAIAAALSLLAYWLFDVAGVFA